MGLAKSGVPGIALLPILMMAEGFDAMESTGILLLILITGDFCAVSLFHRHAVWKHLLRILPPASIGVIIGWYLMGKVPDEAFRPLIGWTIAIMTGLQLMRKHMGASLSATFHSQGFAWAMGLTGGVTTMMANAAGPVMQLFFLSVNLPKYEFVGTGAWFFLIINLYKVPFSYSLGLVHEGTLVMTLAAAPLVLLSARLGKLILQVIPQKVFEQLVLAIAILGAARLILF